MSKVEHYIHFYEPTKLLIKLGTTERIRDNQHFQVAPPNPIKWQYIQVKDLSKFPTEVYTDMIKGLKVVQWDDFKKDSEVLAKVFQEGLMQIQIKI